MKKYLIGAAIGAVGYHLYNKFLADVLIPVYWNPLNPNQKVRPRTF